MRHPPRPLSLRLAPLQVQLEPIAAGARAAHYTSMRQALVTIVKEEGIKVWCVCVWGCVCWGGLYGSADAAQVGGRASSGCSRAAGAKPLRAAPSPPRLLRPTAAQGLWRGTVPGQLLTVPYTAVQFVTLQQCRQLARVYGLDASPRWQATIPFVSGALAGAAATVASYPFDLLRTTLAAQGEPPVYASMTDAGAGLRGGRGPGAPGGQPSGCGWGG